MSDDWYLDDRLWTDFHDCMFAESHFELAEEQVEVLPALIGREPERVLDLACGPGRHTLPMARAGWRVTAVDTSEFLLDKLKGYLASEDLEAEVINQDMREFRRPQGFDLAVCLWTSFGYFDNPEDDQRVLANVHDSLSEDGLFVLDVVGKEYLARNLEPLLVRELDNGALLVERPELSRHLSRLENEWILIDGDQVRRTTFSHNVYSATELQQHLFDAGFTSVAIYGDLDGSDFDLDADRLVLVAGR